MRSEEAFQESVRSMRNQTLRAGRAGKWTCMVVSKIHSGKETARSLPSAYVTAVWLIRHCVRSGSNAA